MISNLSLNLAIEKPFLLGYNITMKKRFIMTILLIPMWEEAIKCLFFPYKLIKELLPGNQLDVWGEDLPVMRNRLRPQLDKFVDVFFDFDEPEQRWQKLCETDLATVSWYYDRLNVASIVLRQALKNKEAVEIPDS